MMGNTIQAQQSETATDILETIRARVGWPEDPVAEATETRLSDSTRLIVHVKVEMDDGEMLTFIDTPEESESRPYSLTSFDRVTDETVLTFEY